jgi:hypothetical protein
VHGCGEGNALTVPPRIIEGAGRGADLARSYSQVLGGGSQAAMTWPQRWCEGSRAGAGLCRQSNRSLSALQIPAGKRFGEARDRAGIFGDDCQFRAAETGLSRVSSGKAPGSLRLFRSRRETVFAQDCVVADAVVIEPVSLGIPVTAGKNANFPHLFPYLFTRSLKY